MNYFHEEDTDIKDLMGHAPASPEAPIELKARLRMMASATKARQTSPWAGRLAIVGVGAIAVIAFSLSMAPSKAWSFERVVNAVDQTNAFELIVRSNKAGADQNVTISAQNGKFMIKADKGALMQIDGATMRVYDPKENSVMELSFGGVVDPKMIAEQVNEGLKQGLKEMDIKKMVNDFAAEYGKDNIHVSPIHQRFGESTYDVILQKPGEAERVHMTVDASTDLPKLIEITGGKDSGTEEDSKIEIRFGGPADPSMENLQFPANAKHVKLDLGSMIQNGMKGMPFGDKDKSQIKDELNRAKEEMGTMFKDGFKNMRVGDKDDKHEEKKDSGKP